MKNLLKSYLKLKKQAMQNTRLQIKLELDCEFDLSKECHILDAYFLTVHHIDEFLDLIKSSPDNTAAYHSLKQLRWDHTVLQPLIEIRQAFAQSSEWYNDNDGITQTGYCLSDLQIDALLNLGLRRLTSLTDESIMSDYRRLFTAPNDVMNQGVRNLFDVTDQLLDKTSIPQIRTLRYTHRQK